MYELARLAEVYGTGEVRLTVEQNCIIPNVPNTMLDSLLGRRFWRSSAPILASSCRL